jgi:hypothetical protein
MIGSLGRATIALVVLLAPACAPLTDDVFTPIVVLSDTPLSVLEGSGVVEIPLRLAARPTERLTLMYRVLGDEAQSDCQLPDFEAASGSVEWAPGSIEAPVGVWIGDDDLAERDERFTLLLESPQQPASAPLGRIEVAVLDDDRTALLSAQELGVIPGAPGDQSAALQAALDRAASLERGVVVMAPGDYEISSVRLPPGTTLSAYGVRWRRPPLSAADTVSLRLQHEGATPSVTSLVEGLTIDGNREQQGPYREHELETAHLIELGGDSEQGGRARLTVERVRLISGTGSGLFVGPSSDVTACGLYANELWRDALTLNGGATSLRVRNLDATATQGTGLWLGARAPGYEGSYRVDVEAEDVRIAAGDVELEVADDSRVLLRRLTMTQAPFRLDAPGGTVRIEQSVLVLGVPSRNQNRWALPHDVELSGTTLVVSESGESEEPTRAFSAVSLIPQSNALGAHASGAGHLVFDDCRFERARDVELDDPLYALENIDVDASVEVVSGKLGAGFSDWFAPACSGCRMAP